MSTRTVARSRPRAPSKRERQKQAAAAAARRRNVFWLLVIGIVALFVVAIAMTGSSTNDGAAGSGGVKETRAVDIEGDALPVLPESGADPAVGMTAPEVSGRDFYGNEISIGSDGRAKAIVFMAHWCPHCQAEVPVVQQWINDNGLPEGVDFYTVSTSVDAGSANYPPSEWLKREGWTLPTIADDAASSTADAFGMSGTPFWVFVKADGTVAARAAGAIGVEGIESHLAHL